MCKIAWFYAQIQTYKRIIVGKLDLFFTKPENILSLYLLMSFNINIFLLSENASTTENVPHQKQKLDRERTRTKNIKPKVDDDTPPQKE